MANYNKSFNFRNGVQVDEDNFLVNSTGLVGIGTTIPRTDLDVYGDASVSGVITSKNLFVSGIATFSTVKVGSAVTINGTLGIVSAFRFLGDGSYLDGIPTSQWVDNTSGPGITSIYVLRNAVGIATNAATRSLQIGGKTESGQKGVGITSDGDIYASGIITATTFYGSGANITSISAANISSGTLNNSRLPSSINLTGVATVGTLTATTAVIGINTLNSNGLTTKEVVSIGFTGDKYYVKSSIDLSSGSQLKFESGSGISIYGYTGSSGDFLIANGSGGIAWSKDISTSGVATVGLLSATDVVVSGVTTTDTIRSQTGIITSLTAVSLNSFFGNFSRVYSGLGTFVNSHATNLYSTGIGTVNTLRFTSGIGTDLTVVHFDTNGITAKQINCGITTFVDLQSTYSTLGVTTTTSLISSGLNVSGITTTDRITTGNIKISHVANTIETTTGNIIIDPLGKIELNKDIIAYYQSYFTGITTVATGILPDTDLGAYLGSSSFAFQHLYAGNLIVGAGTSNKITTKSTDLLLNSNTEKVFIEKDLVVDRNLNVTGITTFSDLVRVNIGLLPDNDLGAFVGSSQTSFQSLYVGDIFVGAGNSNKINTKSSNLILDSFTDRVEVGGDLLVDRHLNVSGVVTFSETVNINTDILPDTSLGADIGSSQKPFNVIYLGDLNLGVGNSNSINTRSQDLILDSITEKVIIDNDAIINRNLSVTGGITTVTTLRTSVGIVPSTTSAYLGTISSPFSELYVENIQIGVGTTDLITTKIGELKLDSFDNIVRVQANLNVSSNLNVTGESYLAGISTIEVGLLPDIDQGSYLGAGNSAFSSAFIGDVQIGSGSSASITTRTGNLEIIPITQLTTIQGKLEVDNLQVSNYGVFDDDVYFGNNGLVTINSSNGRVGIGTSLPQKPLQVVSQNSLEAEFISNSLVRIGLGSKSTGSGTSTGNLYYNPLDKEIGLINEDTGDINFVLHDGSSGINTGFFVWSYGQTETDLMKLSYNGKLGIGGTTNLNYRVYIEPLGIGQTALFVNGDSYVNGNFETVGIVTFYAKDNDETNIFTFNTNTGTLTVKNLVVQGGTSGVTASGIGVTISDDTGSYGNRSVLNFTGGLKVLSSSTGYVDIGIGTFVGTDAIGIGTTIPKSVLDVSAQDPPITAPFILPPRISTATRDSFTPIAGAFIFNTTVSKFQGYTGVAWTDFH